jgi:hypothetical protein
MRTCVSSRPQGEAERAHPRGAADLVTKAPHAPGHGLATTGEFWGGHMVLKGMAAAAVQARMGTARRADVVCH